jgi:hypothetical protein
MLVLPWRVKVPNHSEPLRKSHFRQMPAAPDCVFFLTPLQIHPASRELARVAPAARHGAFRGSNCPFLVLPGFGQDAYHFGRPRCSFASRTVNVQRSSHSDRTWDSAAVVHRRIIVLFPHIGSDFRLRRVAVKVRGH